MGKKKPKPPVPPKEAVEPEESRSWGDQMDSLLATVSEKFPSVKRLDARMIGEPALLSEPMEIKDLAIFLRDNDVLPFNLCRCVTGLDKVDRFEVVYNLAHVPSSGIPGDGGFKTIALVSVITDRENPSTQSLVEVWPTVDFQEREAYDLVGMGFDGHPDLRRILLDEEFKGFPLQKDYPLEGKWEDMQAMDAYLDEHQIQVMKEAAGLDFDPEKDVPPNFKR